MSHKTIDTLLTHKCSRRALLKGTVVLAGSAVLAAVSAPVLAQQMLDKSAVKYQDTPKDGKDCNSCIHFVPGATTGAAGACKVVAGDVAAAGYCLAYTKKPVRQG